MNAAPAMTPTRPTAAEASPVGSWAVAKPAALEDEAAAAEEATPEAEAATEAAALEREAATDEADLLAAEDWWNVSLTAASERTSAREDGQNRREMIRR
jgi:hypothetical protein